MPDSLDAMAKRLAASSVFEGKTLIDEVRSCMGHAFDGWNIRNGDDCAAVPDGQGGWLLLAAEGIIPALVEKSPELAGRSAVLANVNDIYAMGGRPLAMVDVMGVADSGTLRDLCRGMRENALRFGVPIVGGHVMGASSSSVALAILGRAKALLTSFDAAPGDNLVLATSLDGYWLEKENYWNCTLARHDAALAGNLELLPAAAELGLSRAGKDVSMAGIAGTTVMLAEGSKVGCEIDLNRLELPAGHGPEKLEAWLRAFFSYGFLLAVSDENLGAVRQMFAERGLWCESIGRFAAGTCVTLRRGAETALLRDWAKDPLTGFGLADDGSAAGESADDDGSDRKASARLWEPAS
ncbi:MAG: AIR synthase related protein [Desulfovibrionaceae bacterium]|nr:AIR synthase related protein [Desulfovibrionaceae bacterium]